MSLSQLEEGQLSDSETTDSDEFTPPPKKSSHPGKNTSDVNNKRRGSSFDSSDGFDQDTPIFRRNTRASCKRTRVEAGPPPLTLLPYDIAITLENCPNDDTLKVIEYAKNSKSRLPKQEYNLPLCKFEFNPSRSQICDIPPVDAEPGEIFDTDNDTAIDAPIDGPTKDEQVKMEDTAPRTSPNISPKKQSKASPQKKSKESEKRSRKHRPISPSSSSKVSKDSHSKTKTSPGESKVKAYNSIFHVDRKPIRYVRDLPENTNELVPALATKRTKAEYLSTKTPKLKKNETSSSYINLQNERKKSFRSALEPDSDIEDDKKKEIDRLLKTARSDTKTKFKIPKKSATNSSSSNDAQLSWISLLAIEGPKYKSDDLVHLLIYEPLILEPPYGPDDLYCVFVLPEIKEKLKAYLPPQ